MDSVLGCGLKPSVRSSPAIVSNVSPQFTVLFTRFFFQFTIFRDVCLHIDKRWKSCRLSTRFGHATYTTKCWNEWWVEERLLLMIYFGFWELYRRIQSYFVLKIKLDNSSHGFSSIHSFFRFLGFLGGSFFGSLWALFD